MVLPKVKKISLLVLLVLVSFVLSAVKFFSGEGKISKSQAQAAGCWTPPAASCSGSCSCQSCASS